MSHFHAWRSLRTQLQLGVIRTALLTGCIATVIGYCWALHNAEDQARQSLQQSLNSLTYTAAIAAFTDDQNLAENTLKGVLSNSFVCTAQIISLDGRLHQQQNKQQIHHQNSGTCRPGPQMWLDSPFMANNHIGTFQATLYWPAVQIHALHVAFNEFLGLVLLLLGSTWASWQATNRLLTKPLVHLSQTVHALIPGQNSQLIIPAAHQRNELGVLIHDINDLLILVAQTIGDERRIRQQMEVLKLQYQSIFEQARTGICLVDTSGQCTLANPSTARALQLSLPCDGPFCLIGNWIDQIFKEPSRLRELMQQTVQTGQTTLLDMALRPYHPCTLQPWINISISAHQTQPLQGMLLECILIDITERKKIEEDTRYKAEHDPLTHLYNRNSGIQLLENTLCTSLTSCALLLIDLDRFKWINDHYGHQAGDLALIHVARKLSETARTADIVIRLGGDEFLVGLVDIGNINNLHHIVERIICEATQPFAVSAQAQERIGVSIGIALYPEASTELIELMSQADIAMYRVKQAGRGGYCIYNGKEYQDVVLSTPGPRLFC